MRAAIYARSDHDTAAQLAACRAYVGVQGGTVTDEYDDQGGDFSLMELLHAATSGRFDTVVVADRLFLGPAAYTEFVEILGQSRIKLINLSDIAPL